MGSDYSVPGRRAVSLSSVKRSIMARKHHMADTDLEGPATTPQPQAPVTGSSNMQAACSHGNLTFLLIQMNTNNMRLRPLPNLGQI